MPNPVTLIAHQVFNVWFFGILAGVGLMLFQRLIPRPGLASGLYTNTRRLAAIVSGPIIAFGSTTAFGYQGVFAALTVLALAVIASTSRPPRRMRPKEFLAATAPADPAAGARS